MAYTAIEKMRQDNFAKFGVDVGPFSPKATTDGEPFSLKRLSLEFLRSRCENLCFDSNIESLEEKSGKYYGTSAKPNQIPYNMQMDINRMCLEKELSHFIDSGVAEDAYNVYYCFLEMFFGHYGKSKKMVELLSEYESNGSSLLMKHRDHYSHSVYVFTLGLAIYESNFEFRTAFKKFYDIDTSELNKRDDIKAAHLFLKYWGLTSLFHDIGYPFELPFEQVVSYFEVDNKHRDDGTIFISYNNISELTKIQDKLNTHFLNKYKRSFATTNDYFSYMLCRKLGSMYSVSEQQLKEILHDKPIHPEKFSLYMDHAWFSATRLFQEISNTFEPKEFDDICADSLCSILLHNSLFKFSIKDASSHAGLGSPLNMYTYPLAYLLMLCDELQCWDRTAYGRNSRTELHPMDADFDFSNGKIQATYFFDEEEKEKIDDYNSLYKAWCMNPNKSLPPRLKAYSDIAGDEQSFLNNIRNLVDISNIHLKISASIKKSDRKSKHTYLSNSNFLHLYDFAVALNARYSYNGYEKNVISEDLEKEFESLSLEYQLSNINQAKSFARYLNDIGCFYTDKPVDFDMLHLFTQCQLQTIGPLEHKRWVLEHREMGWREGNYYETLDINTEPTCGIKQYQSNCREQMRMHKLMVNENMTSEQIIAHYLELPADEQEKDWAPLNSMLMLIKHFDGLRIYKLPDSVKI